MTSIDHLHDCNYREKTIYIYICMNSFLCVIIVVQVIDKGHFNAAGGYVEGRILDCLELIRYCEMLCIETKWELHTWRGTG